MNIELFDGQQSGRPQVRRLEVSAGVTVREALDLAGVVPAVSCGLAVFGREVTLDTVLEAGDRLEVCAPLITSPMEARRAREGRRPKT